MSESPPSQEHLLVSLSADLLARGCRVRFSAKGNCMNPVLRDGELITVAPVDPRRVRRGDIVLYRTEKFALAHRVVEIEEGADLRFILKADSSGACDQPVEAGRILGRVVSVERGGRSLDPNRAWARFGRFCRRSASRLERLLKRAEQAGG